MKPSKGHDARFPVGDDQYLAKSPTSTVYDNFLGCTHSKVVCSALVLILHTRIIQEYVLSRKLLI